MDQAVKPGDDFYSYANGSWQKQVELPPNRNSIGQFPDLRYYADDKVHALLEDLSKDDIHVGSPEDKLSSLFQAFTDEAVVEKLGLTPLAAELAEVRKVRTWAEMAELMGHAQMSFHASLFNLEIGYDQTEPTRFAVRLGQGGIRLPDRDYYLEPKFKATKAAYEAYAAEMLKLVGWPNAAREAHALVGFETQIAEASWADRDVRDSSRNAHPQSISQLAADAPRFPWKQFMKGAALKNVDRVIDTSDTSLPKIAAVFQATPLSTLKAWEAFRTADAAAPYLSSQFVNASFAFSRHLTGRSEQPARWRRGVELVNTTMGSAVGKLYVAKYFSPQTQEMMTDLVANLVNALRDRIETLDWMEPSTKAEALRKLAVQHVQVGYPGEWRDYSALQIRSNDLFGDVVRSRDFDWRRQIAKIGGPWDPSEWRFWPQYPTAYGENRELIFTAAMLQPPFFDPKADPAINYGAIGGVIGHELTHNYDDRGRQEDSEIKLRDWWTPKDAALFKSQAERLVAQFSAMEPLPGMHIKGDVTVGENLADLGGVKIALAAYHGSLHGQAAPVIDGFTGDQRFFFGWAQGWRFKMQDAALRQQITSDLHSPAVARVNGLVRNIDEWYAAFGVSPGQALYLDPSDRVRLW